MSNFTFAHLADCHLGGWRDERMREVGVESFIKAIDISLERKVDFIIIAGDLFNTALPSFDVLRIVVAKLQEVKKTCTPVYYIAGSHDYSPAGKTMLHVLSEAELAKDVLRGYIDEDTGKLKLDFVLDEKTGAKLCGILGRAQSLEKTHYELLDHAHLEKEDGFKIFAFHTTINELKPKELEDVSAIQLSLLPRGFDYYAGGHVHIRLNEVIQHYGRIVYPGPTYPNNFLEIEKLTCGSFVINEVVDNEITKSEFIEINDKKVLSKTLNCDQKNPEQVYTELEKWISELSTLNDTIITLRLNGELQEGTVGDIGLRSIEEQLLAKGAYIVMKNTAALTKNMFSSVQTDLAEKEDVEKILLKEHLDTSKKINERDEHSLADLLMTLLDNSKLDGETNSDFEDRLLANVKEELRLD